MHLYVGQDHFWHCNRPSRWICELECFVDISVQAALSHLQAFKDAQYVKDACMMNVPRFQM